MTRQFDFTGVGPETATLPTAGTPTNDADTINKGWLEEYGFDRSAIHDGVASISALRAITAAVRQDKQICLVQNTGLYEFDSTDSQTDDGSTIIQPDAGSGRWLLISAVGGGGAGSEYTALAGEWINGSTKTKSIGLLQKTAIEIANANSWIDVNEGAGEISVKILGTDSFFLIQDLDTNATNPGDAAFDLCKIIADTLTADGSTTLTYTCTYSLTTNLITLAASGAFTILLKTGAHGLDNLDTGLLAQIGWDDSSDTGSLTSHPADNKIQDAEAIVTKLQAQKTDSDFLIKSRGYHGGIDENATKLAQVTCSINTAMDGFAAFTEGEKQYTQSAAIILDATNNKLDWKEGAGGEINSTLTQGTYLRGTDSSSVKYETLAAELKLQMDTDTGVADTFTVTYDNNTGKFKVVSDGVNSFTFLFGTGTNTATGVHTTIGWDASDTTSDTSHESDNAVDLAGETAEDIATRTTTNSVFTGFIDDNDKQFMKQAYDISTYDELYKSPGDFPANPTEFDQGNEIQFMDSHMNLSGQGVAIFEDLSTNNIIIRYTTNGGYTWTTAATTPSMGFSVVEDFGASNVTDLRAKCFVDENGNGVIAYSRANGAQRNATAAHSTDLNTWGVTNLHTAGATWYNIDLYIREDKAVIMEDYATHTNTVIYISNNVGAGYNSWSAQIPITPQDFYYTKPSHVKIQYWPGVGSPNDYRIILVGQKQADLDLYAVYMAGDGTGQTAINPWTPTNYMPINVTMDKAGTGNRIAIVAADGGAIPSSSSYAVGLSNDSSGSFSISTKGTIALTGNHDSYNGHTNGSDWQANMWNEEVRAVLHDTSFSFVSAAFNGGYIRAQVHNTKDITAGSPSWESVVSLDDTATSHMGHYCCTYLPSIHSILFAWKRGGSATGNLLTQGIIMGRLANINADGSLSFHDAEQIDGGEALSGFQGWVNISSSADRAFVMWERYNGATRDTLMYIPFI
jgi:hypothetical protein